jgi:hypothetical protein
LTAAVGQVSNLPVSIFFQPTAALFCNDRSGMLMRTTSVARRLHLAISEVKRRFVFRLFDSEPFNGSQRPITETEVKEH